MAKTFDLWGTKWTVNPDGKTVTNVLGQTTALAGLPLTNPLAQAAKRASEEGPIPSGVENPNINYLAPAATQIQSEPVASSGAAVPVVPNVPAPPATNVAPSETMPRGYDPNEIMGYIGGQSEQGESAVNRSQRVLPGRGEARAFENYVDASRKLNDVAIETVNQQAEFEKQRSVKAAEVADMNRQLAADTAKTNTEIELEVQKKNDEYNQALRDAQSIKPRDFWADKSTFGKVMAGISIGFGAAAQAMSGGSNPGLDIIKSAIQTDLEKQKQQMELAQGRVVNARNAIGLASSIGQDKLTRDQAAKGLAMNAVRSQIEAISQNAASAEMAAKGKQLLAQFDQWAAQEDLNRQQGLRTTVESSISGRTGKGIAITRGELYGTGVPWSKIMMDPEKRRLVVADENVIAHDADAVKIIRADKVFTEQMQNDISELRRYYQKGNKLSRKERQRASSLYGEIFAKVKGPEYFNAGAALSEGEIATITRIIGTDPTAKNVDALFEAPITVLNTAEKMFQNAHRLKIKAYTQPIYGRPGFQDERIMQGEQTAGKGYELTPH